MKNAIVIGDTRGIVLATTLKLLEEKSHVHIVGNTELSPSEILENMRQTFE